MRRIVGLIYESDKTLSGVSAAVNRNNIADWIIVIFTFLALITLVYLGEAGELDVFAALVMLASVIFSILLSAIAAGGALWLIYLIFKELENVSIEKPPQIWKAFFRLIRPNANVEGQLPLTDLLIALIFLYVLAMALTEIFFLAQFKEGGMIAYFAPVFVAGYILLYRFFVKRGNKELSDTMLGVLLVAIVLALAQGMASNGFQNITMPRLERQFVAIAAAGIDFLALEVGKKWWFKK
ncbi:MAG: hypothetical protein V1676_07000 [Candidatus Diapherotrites archaeon]